MISMGKEIPPLSKTGNQKPCENGGRTDHGHIGAQRGCGKEPFRFADQIEYHLGRRSAFLRLLFHFEPVDGDHADLTILKKKLPSGCKQKR